MRPSGSRTSSWSCPAVFRRSWGREHEDELLGLLGQQGIHRSCSSCWCFAPSRPRPLGKRFIPGPTCAPCPAPPPSTGGDERPLWCGPHAAGWLMAWRFLLASKVLDRLELPAAGQLDSPRRWRRHLPPRRSRVCCWPNSASTPLRVMAAWCPPPGCQLIVHSGGAIASSSAYLAAAEAAATASVGSSCSRPFGWWKYSQWRAPCAAWASGGGPRHCPC